MLILLTRVASFGGPPSQRTAFGRVLSISNAGRMSNQNLRSNWFFCPMSSGVRKVQFGRCHRWVGKRDSAHLLEVRCPFHAFYHHFALSGVTTSESLSM